MKIIEMRRFMRRSYGIVRLVFVFFIFISINACVPTKNFVYFHNLKSDTLHPGVIAIDGTTQFVEPKIQVNDILSVSIQTLTQSESSELVMAKASGGNEDPMSGFLVDKNGYIELSMIGFVKVGGLTTAEARELIKQRVKEFYKDPVVNVHISNFDVTVLGDVSHPGIVKIHSEKANIIDVLALAGDLTITGQRKNVLLARTEGTKTTFVRFDLTSTDIFKSPYFYVKQRDYIYVEPNKYKRQTSDNSFTRYLSYMSAVIGVTSILFLFKVIKVY
jgi:polysaccharide biosynthesis/export protein